jgi:Dolichyl-phosphate-mannose-protein mannosyltransferase
MPSTSVPPPAEAIQPERVVDPDVWLEVVAWAVIALSAVQILLFSFGRDQAIYATVADGILHGKMPYRDLWDFKPPGIFLVYALSQAVFGKTMLAPRLLEVIGLVAMVFTFQRLSETFFGVRRIGLVGGAIAALIQAELEFWHTGQPETFGGYLTAFALLLTVRPGARSRRYWRWASIGALFGCAFLLKPPLGGGALIAAAYVAREEYARDEKKLTAFWPVLVMGLSSFVPILGCAAWFWARGAWPALDWTLFQFTPGYTKLGWADRSAPEMFYWGLEELFFRFSALAAAGVIAAVVIRPMHEREREGVFLILGLLAIHLAGIAMQGKFFQYHYAASLPFVSLIAGLGIYKLWRRTFAAGAGGIVAFASFLVVAVSMRLAVRDLGSFWDRSLMRTEYLLHTGSVYSRALLDKELYRVADYNLDADRQVAIELGQRVAPGGKVFVWGFEPAIYWMSGRDSASRYIYDVPQRVSWSKERARRELIQDLAQNPPRMIVVQHGDRFAWVTGDNHDSAEAVEGFPELDLLLERDFAFATTIEDFDLYERR